MPGRQPAACLLGAVDVAITTAGMASGALLGVGFGRGGIGQVGPTFSECFLDTPLHVMQAGAALFGHADVARAAGFVRLGAGLRPQPAVGISEIDRVRCTAVAGDTARLGVNVVQKSLVHQDLLPERHGPGIGGCLGTGQRTRRSHGQHRHELFEQSFAGMAADAAI